MPMNPEAGESQEDFMHRCISHEMDKGHPQDQAVAMCMNMWEGKSVAVPVLRRAYGVMQVKSFNDEQRLLEGLATTPTPDRMGDVVNPLGATMNLPIPLLYQHASTAPVGEVFEARPTKEGIHVRARIFKATQSKTLMERLDEAWESVKIGLVKGFSIGFQPIGEPEQIGKGFGLHYKLWEFLELSLVTIPANHEATITAIKGFAMRPQSVVKLDEATLAIARKQTRPGVVYAKK